MGSGPSWAIDPELVEVVRDSSTARAAPDAHLSTEEARDSWMTSKQKVVKIDETKAHAFKSFSMEELEICQHRPSPQSTSYSKRLRGWGRCRSARLSGTAADRPSVQDREKAEASATARTYANVSRLVRIKVQVHR